MSGPYCKDCDNFKKHFFSEEWGECIDKAKEIYMKYGSVRYSKPEVLVTDTCNNWQKIQEEKK